MAATKREKNSSFAAILNYAIGNCGVVLYIAVLEHLSVS